MTSTNCNRDARVGKALRNALDLDLKGETAMAVEELSGVLEELPRVAILHAYLSAFLSRCERFDEAVKHGREAVRLAPASEMASLVYFQALWTAGRGVEAFQEMQRYLVLQIPLQYTNVLLDWDLGEQEHSPSREN